MNTIQNSIATDIRKLNLTELREFLVLQGIKPFRAKQIYEWIWRHGSTDFDSMTNLSQSLRSSLKDHFCFRPISLDIKQNSQDGTIKCRYLLHDGHMIETVIIPVPEKKRYTVCVSSQVGCSLDCSFCATGRMKRIRNLDASEIYDQVRLAQLDCQAYYDAPLTNIVYMGMGEPLLAYHSVMSSIDRITDAKYGLGMSPRRITVSTAGIAKMIDKLAEREVRFNLALSLHAANDEKRSEIMSINDSNNLEALMNSLKNFHQKAKGAISYEYIALRDFNTDVSDAQQLARLCSHFPVKVNIIEYNNVEGLAFAKEDQAKVDRFAQVLERKGITVTVRRSRGQDIDAACGQLANNTKSD